MVLQPGPALRVLFPACAGVIPAGWDGEKQLYPVPRMRGGDPSRKMVMESNSSCSPHARG